VYCLVPNHVHLVLTPVGARAVGEAHRGFTAFANARAGATGQVFQGRFALREGRYPFPRSESFGRVPNESARDILAKLEGKAEPEPGNA
jgi:hypothetical protein